MENKVVEIFNKVFLWMGIGLLISFGIGYYLSQDIELMLSLVGDYSVYTIALAPLVLAFVFKIFINKLPTPVLYVLYIAFAAIIGVTFGSIFIVYELSSIISIFLLTSLIFGVMASYGYITKKDLTSFGKILLIGLIIIIVFSLVNIFIIKSEMIDVIITAVSALIFIGFIAYDVQKIKKLIGQMEDKKLQIYGAFELYIDFVNLFLDLIRLLGKKN